MQRRLLLVVALVLATSIATFFLVEAKKRQTKEEKPKITQGALNAIAPDGKSLGACPLKHTDAKAQISGFLVRVNVTQEFENPFKDKIEAVYTFPLSQRAAVDDMTMRVGDRTVRGKIMKREEAQAVYEAAKERGNVAALLDQERPNIFTQSVANIMPGEKVTVQISYVEVLKYEEGSYEFVFPMVVGPRYNPGNATGKQGGGYSPDTTQVPDGSRITPQPFKEGMRAGHDISIEVALDAGVPIESFKSSSHEVETQNLNNHAANIRLKNQTTIPNKDFILRYDVSGKKVEDAILTHRAERGGFFTMILQPPDQPRVEDVTPKEIVFVLDTSGSMSGFPIEKAKESMKLALYGLYPNDTFNLITFAGDTHILFDKPVPATKENLAKAQKFLETREGGGGTEMMKAIKAALDPSDSQQHIRIVCFMTDGYVGDDMAIIGEVKNHPNARVFSFGIGSSVNRFLLDKMAEEGRGEVEYVSLNDDGSLAAKRFHERIRNPLLTDVSVDWNGLPVADVYPKRIPDFFSAKPVVLSGRFTGAAKGTIRLKGKMSGREVVKEIAVDFPERQTGNDVLATLWARNRIDDLMSQDWSGVQKGNPKDDLKNTITQLGLEYRLLTQFTSFVAVEEMIVTDGGTPRRVDVPVEMPEGISYKGVFGDEEERRKTLQYAQVSGLPMRIIGGGGGGNANANRSVLKNTPKKAKVAKEKTSNDKSTVTDGREIDANKPLTKEEQRQQALQSKTNDVVFALIQRLKDKKAQPSAEEAKFVKDGKANIQVWLVDKTPEAIEELKKLEFEVVLNPTTSKLIIGRIAIEKLEALVELKSVRFVNVAN
jgi:Ca-activated chloride channel family protein